MMTVLRWLHLSDLHAGAPSHEQLWPTIREEFIRDLRRLVRNRHPVDIVVVSGDLTQAGRKEQFGEFDKTVDVVLDLLSHDGLRPPVFAVPGNHDLHRPLSTKPEVRLLERWHEEPEVRREFWAEKTSPYRQVLTDAFADFTDWRSGSANSSPDQTQGLLPGDSSLTIEKDGTRFGVVGLNTAFLQLSDTDWEQKLDLDTRQFNAATGGDGPAWCAACDLALLVTHHPPKWLSPSALKTLRTEISPPGRFIAHLYGHMHQGESASVSEGGSQVRRFFQAPSMFGLRSCSQELERSHGYYLGELSIANERAKLRLWPRCALRLQSGEWKIGPDPRFKLNRGQGTRIEAIAIKPKVQKGASESQGFRPRSPRRAGAPTTVVVGPTALQDCLDADIPHDAVTEFIERDARNHPAMFAVPFHSLPFPFGNLIVLVSFDGKETEIERVLARSIAYTAFDLWASALALYRKCTLLPYRIHGVAALQLPAHRLRTLGAYDALIARVASFLETAGQARARDTASAFGARDLVEEARLVLHDGNESAAIARMEAALSVVHKVLVHQAPGIPPQGADGPASRQIGDDGHPAILLVDDEPLLIRAASRILQDSRWSICTAATGRAALRLLVDREFAVLITDIMMPEMDGISVVAACRAVSPRTKVVVLTGHKGAYEELTNELRSLIDFQLMKPFDGNELRKVVERFVADWLEQDRPGASLS